MLDPARDPSPRPPVGPALPGSAAAPGVLVIDDDPVHLMVLCKTAERAGFVATSAASFGAAVACLRRGGLSAVTLDLSLGRRNGLDVMHALVEMGCRIPIVIVSGSDAALRSETVSMAALMKLDVRAALPKPVDLTLLRQVLVRVRQTTEACPLPA